MTWTIIPTHIALFLLERLFKIFEDDAIDAGDDLPNERENGRDGFLASFDWSSDVVHDHSEQVVEEDETSLRRKLGVVVDEPSQVLNDEILHKSHRTCQKLDPFHQD